MFATETHAMELVQVDATGAEEWYCPICGRHFQMRWPPDYAKVVLEPGDEYATHTGGKGGLQMGAPELLDAEAYLPTPTLAADLAPEPPLAEDVADLWRRLLNDLDQQE